MTIAEARAKGLTKVRRAIWASPLDYLELGPLWHKLYSPMNQHLNGRDPVPILGVEDGEPESDWIEHTGPDCKSDEYRAAVEEWNRPKNFGHTQPCGCRDCATK